MTEPKDTLEGQMAELDAAIEDLRRALSAAFAFDWAKARGIPWWLWGGLLVLGFDVAVKLTALGLNALGYGR